MISHTFNTKHGLLDKMTDGGESFSSNFRADNWFYQLEVIAMEVPRIDMIAILGDLAE